MLQLRQLRAAYDGVQPPCDRIQAVQHTRRMQAAYRLHTSVSGLDFIGLQCVIVGVDAGIHDVETLHAAAYDGKIQAACIPSGAPALHVTPNNFRALANSGVARIWREARHCLQVL